MNGKWEGGTFFFFVIILNAESKSITLYSFTGESCEIPFGSIMAIRRIFFYYPFFDQANVPTYIFFISSASKYTVIVTIIYIFANFKFRFIFNYTCSFTI